MHMRGLKTAATGAAATIFTFVALLTSPTPALSVEVAKKSEVKEVGASERVAFSDKLRMYSQRMASSACNLNAGINPQYSRGFLAVSAREFDRIVNAIEYGDKALGIIGSERRRKTLSYISKLRGQWEPMREIVQQVLADGPTDAMIMDLADRNTKLMDLSAIVVSEISGQYSDPTALVQSDALRLGIAGRQRMLTQKMSSEACLAFYGGDTAELAATVARFDLSQTALHNGMPNAGVYPSDNEKIKEGLVEVSAQWSQVKQSLDALAAGASWDAKTRGNVFNALNDIQHTMDKAVILYTKDSKIKSL